MELIAVLEPEECPQKAIWYTLVPKGENPGVRVGHTLTVALHSSGKGKVIIVGGANPNGSFSDAHILELDTLEWNIPEWEGLLPRYEHCTFIPANRSDNLWLFGGADQCGNRNCVQVLNFETGAWRSPAVSGTPPTPRTFHSSTAAIGDCLYVFGGGDKGAEPVQDTQLHVFDTTSLSWSQPSTEGKSPTPRHGHVMVAVGSKLFVHGGLAGVKFLNDMYSLNTVTMKWEKLKVKGDVPAGCAAHSSVSLGKYIYIFGGMDTTGALNSMYKYHIERRCWMLLKFDSSLPPRSLDHAMCVLPWKVRTEAASRPCETIKNDKDTAKGEVAEESLRPDQHCKSERDTPTTVHVCLIFGGMDTGGEIYNDCYVTLLDDQ
ncbi:rab9 effector protein with kelch motifs isoform X1 [Callorhinchus milii]|uniref:rab9 effector protein with kelch motifs isoform X1 n=1 Tax=Callorhinchus milii TaxID=7868 RepID=UPI001C3FA9CC|nr:rab9 effector protein with kelch motifs isoform X1 [Callorhinchus milii]XP_007907716.2 rab9 effector protein with kelch motifs isoform X1 [Callorhinchus milii]XP_042193204.1 rab9 effector protein with kelch motifs isoform X1 [Callorhinchus milii]